MGRGPRWSADEDALVADLARLGVSSKEAARIISLKHGRRRSAGAVCDRLRALARMQRLAEPGANVLALVQPDRGRAMLDRLTRPLAEELGRLLAERDGLAAECRLSRVAIGLAGEKLQHLEERLAGAEAARQGRETIIGPD